MRRTLDPDLLDTTGAIIYGVAKGLLQGDALRRLDGKCPMHDRELLVTKDPPRCAKCLEALRDETWPTGEPTKGRRR